MSKSNNNKLVVFRNGKIYTIAEEDKNSIPPQSNNGRSSVARIKRMIGDEMKKNPIPSKGPKFINIGFPNNKKDKRIKTPKETNMRKETKGKQPTVPTCVIFREKRQSVQNQIHNQNVQPKHQYFQQLQLPPAQTKSPCQPLKVNSVAELNQCSKCQSPFSKAKDKMPGMNRNPSFKNRVICNNFYINISEENPRQSAPESLPKSIVSLDSDCHLNSAIKKEECFNQVSLLKRQSRNGLRRPQTSLKSGYSEISPYQDSMFQLGDESQKDQSYIEYRVRKYNDDTGLQLQKLKGDHSKGNKSVIEERHLIRQSKKFINGFDEQTTKKIDTIYNDDSDNDVNQLMRFIEESEKNLKLEDISLGQNSQLEKTQMLNFSELKSEQTAKTPIKSKNKGIPQLEPKAFRIKKMTPNKIAHHQEPNKPLFESDLKERDESYDHPKSDRKVLPIRIKHHLRGGKNKRLSEIPIEYIHKD